jgi:recombination protein RecA
MASASQDLFLIPSSPAALELPTGRLIEISADGATARLSLAVLSLLAAQQRGRLAAWIQFAGGGLYPPDVAACGADLQALAVIHVPKAAGVHGCLRSAEILLRSGAFGLVVIDLINSRTKALDMHVQQRLLGLVRAHDAGLLFLTDGSSQAPSLGHLISLRLRPERRAIGDGWFAVYLQTLKAKTSAPLSLAPQLFRGPLA